MKNGRIVKLTGGLYTVQDETGSRYDIKPRGLFRHKDISPKVGDNVLYSEDAIENVLPRDNELVRPPIANVDQAILIHSAKEPTFSFYLLDRFLVLVEKEHIKPVIIVTKIDLLSDTELITLKKQLNYYEQYYDIYFTSTKEPSTLTTIQGLLANKISVFAGQTGAGKSSLLNALDIDLDLETGTISKALGRGKHTTRHTELHKAYDGLVADTPGFSKLDFYDLEKEDIKDNYPDFVFYQDACKFRGCVHLNEPKCAVKAAVENGDIPKFRYDNYKLIYNEIEQKKTIYKKGK
ncbi:MAG: ribosome small subunit-dependent GTPase A [Bacillota bacterium]